jgi:heme/copper-type cytochrome/quinol oxidase subunit 3
MAVTVRSDVPLIDAPPPPAPRPRVMVVGIALAAGAAVVLFAGLLGYYLAQRHDVLAHHQEWLPKGALPLTGPNIALFTLLLSVGTMHWALQAIGDDDRVNAWIALGLTFVLGAAFINATSFIYVHLHVGLAKSKGALLLATVTGTHLAMVAAAMVFLLVIAFRALGGQYDSSDRDGVLALTIWWDVTVAVFAVLWYAIYITK